MIKYYCYLPGKNDCLTRVSAFYGVAFPEGNTIEEMDRGMGYMLRELKGFYLAEKDIAMLRDVVFLPSYQFSTLPTLGEGDG